MSNNSNTVFNLPKELNNSNTVFNLPNSNPKRYQHTISQYSNGSNSSRASPVPYPSKSNLTNSTNSMNSLPTFRFKSLTQKRKLPGINRLRITAKSRTSNAPNMSKLHKTIQKYDIPMHIKQLKQIKARFNEYDTYINNTIPKLNTTLSKILKIQSSLGYEKNYIKDTTKNIDDTIKFLESELSVNLTNDEYKLLHNEDVTLIFDISQKMHAFDTIHDEANHILRP